MITSTCVALKSRSQLVLHWSSLFQQLEGQVIFAPGPRGLLIPKDRLEAIYDLHPILHVNEAEALAFSGCREIQPAIEYLYQRTGQLVIVTWVKRRGCL
ncbi:MAG: hypothetical protein ACLRZG_06530 [Streptococcus sp.]